MNKYPNIVKKNELIMDDNYKDKCPKCDSMQIVFIESRYTLLGFHGKPYGITDPNHYESTIMCTVCGEKYIKHMKCAEIWITDEYNRLLAGTPNCFENFVLTCNYCGGKVFKIYTKLDGITECQCQSYKDGVKQFREFYTCKDCRRKEELD